MLETRLKAFHSGNMLYTIRDAIKQNGEISQWLADRDFPYTKVKIIKGVCFFFVV